MSYRPEITFLEDTNDISDDVLAFNGSHGVNIYGYKDNYHRLEIGGTMILDNADDYWTPARLAGLGVIKMMHKNDVLMQAIVIDFDYQPKDRTVRCELGTANALQYFGSIELNGGNIPGQAGMGFSIAEIVGASGLTITPEEPWATGLNMDQGRCTGPKKRISWTISRWRLMVSCTRIIWAGCALWAGTIRVAAR